MQSRKTPQADLENKRGTWRSVGFTSVLALLLAALAWTSYDVNIVRALDFEVDLLEDEVIPVNVIPPPPPPPPPQQNTVIEIVDDEEEIEEELEIEDIEIDEDTEIEIIEVEEEEVVEEDIPFMIVEDMPGFGPCKSKTGPERDQCTQLEIIKYVSSNTKYPPIAKDAGIQGTVFVYFVVGKDGKVQDGRVLRPVDPRLDEEALRVVSSLPDFEPDANRASR